ncbi:hypothetical protein CEQ21_02785 [Niallia circulans]|uniref:Uncharacterized protein n=1 Tax=Niallia circulans TaxID=1397 RepID=A0A553SSB6_NIACI|nr:hypothetical protein [Niallia circulans]TRZ39889.1 hypothetical protein CEQ21_02785 [Niallia circulans]
MKIYIGLEHYDREKEEFLVKPNPDEVWIISDDEDDISKLYKNFFTQLNQFPLYITFQWYDYQFANGKKELDELEFEYSHLFIPQERAIRMMPKGRSIHFDILMFTVKITNSRQFIQLVDRFLLPDMHFIVSNQDNLTFGPLFYKEDSITFHMNETTTIGIKGHDICLISFISNQWKDPNELVKLFPEDISIEIYSNED